MENFRGLTFLKNLKGVGKAKIYKKYWEYLQNDLTVNELAEVVVEQENGITISDVSDAMEKAGRLNDSLIDASDLYVITALDDDYPDRLKVMGNKRPLILYVRGNREALYKPNIAIVGTRHPSEWSQKVEERLVKKTLEMSDRVVVSGLALGCDKIAHKTTVDMGKETIAVLPSGVNVITPAAHRGLAQDIIDNGGCLVSEYEPNVKASRAYFVERDSLVAALSDVTFVVQCGVKSGTMHTVDAAFKYERKLGCYYPTSMELGDYSGNEYMIKMKNAVKVSDTDDLIDLLTDVSEQSKESQQLSFEDLLQ